MRKFPILLYHRVGPRDGSFMDAWTVSPEAFETQMEQLERGGWQPVSLERAMSDDADLPRRAVSITFDDGFASNRDFAWPVLRRMGFPSDTFVVTERLAQLNTWDGPENATWPLLSRENLTENEGGLMAFHSHSATHPELTMIADDGAGVKRELARDGKDRCGLHLGDGFAYPFGNWNWQIVDEVRAAGYRWACTCLEGLNSRKTDPFLLRRVEIEEADIGTRLTLKLLTGRNLLRWPPPFPPEIHLAKALISKELAKHGIGRGTSRAKKAPADGLYRDCDEGPAKPIAKLPGSDSLQHRAR